MSARTNLTTVEAKLFLREPIGVFWALLFPVVLLSILGLAFPGFLDPDPAWGGLRPVDGYLPVVLVVALATVGISVAPQQLATAREFGLLRRMATTPVPPRRLLEAQFTVQVVVAVLAAGLAVTAGLVAFGIRLPVAPLWAVTSFVLGAAAVFAIGLLVGATASSVSAATGIGMAIYFPMLFFSGVYFPRDFMSPGLRLASDLTPVGAAAQALQDAWFVGRPSLGSLGVMAAYTLVFGFVAIRSFRLE